MSFAYLVVAHVLVVPVALQPVLRSVLLDKVVDAVPEVVGLQQQQLDYEVANLSLVAFVATHGLEAEKKRGQTQRTYHIVFRFLYVQVPSHQTQDESIQGDDVVLPHHVVEYFDAFVELLSAGGCRELVDKEVCKRSHVSHQRTSPDTLQDPGGHRISKAVSASIQHNSVSSHWTN